MLRAAKAPSAQAPQFAARYIHSGVCKHFLLSIYCEDTVILLWFAGTCLVKLMKAKRDANHNDC